MPLPDLALSLARPAVIYDFWNSFDPIGLSLPDGIAYMPLGGAASETLVHTATTWRNAI
jgi:hypothetical protein